LGEINGINLSGCVLKKKGPGAKSNNAPGPNKSQKYQLEFKGVAQVDCSWIRNPDNGNLTIGIRLHRNVIVVTESVANV
jgi:hypothetical protein